MTSRRKKAPIPLMGFERSDDPLLPLPQFWRRLLRGLLWGAAIIGGSLIIGVVGYHQLAHLGWVDSILNASMILGGMGPVDELHSRAAKLFASAYALFSGVALLTSVGVLFAPIVHRFMHHFHMTTDES